MLCAGFLEASCDVCFVAEAVNNNPDSFSPIRRSGLLWFVESELCLRLSNHSEYFYALNQFPSRPEDDFLQPGPIPLSGVRAARAYKSPHPPKGPSTDRGAVPSGTMCSYITLMRCGLGANTPQDGPETARLLRPQRSDNRADWQ